MHLTEGALFVSQTRTQLFTAQTHTLYALDVGTLAASIAQHMQVPKKNIMLDVYL
jgi:hypothetical protein